MSEGLIALALGAGLLAAVNPCGFALLPAYVSLLMASGEDSSRPRAVGRALLLTAAMTTGFAGVFAAFGLAVAPVASGIQQHLPWFTVGFGLVLALLGVWTLAGRSLPRLSLGRSRTGGARPLSGSLVSMTGFGAGYAVASLSCTVAPFLAVVVGGFRAGSAADGIVLFLAYAAGMGLVVGTVAVATALASTGAIGRLRSAGRWAPRVAGALLALTGAYVAYYGWWELRVLSGGNPDDRVIEAAAALQQALAGAVDAPGVLGWVAIAAGVLVLGLGATAVSSRRRSPTELTSEPQ